MIENHKRQFDYHMENNETELLVYKKNKYPVLLHIFNVQCVKNLKDFQGHRTMVMA